jgi:Sulfatase
MPMKSVSWLTRIRGRSGGMPPRSPSGGGRTYPFAALLFGPASVLDVMSRNLNQASFADVAPAIAGTVAFALAVWLIAVAVRRRADAGAALIACVWTVGSVFYLELVRHLNRALEGGYAMLPTLPFVLAAMIVLTVAAHRWGRSLGVVHTVVTGIALVMVLTPGWRAVAYELRNGDARLAYDAGRAAAEMPELAPAAGGAERPPDIFHFVFDRYGSEETLARHYGIDEPIGEFLESRGFYVARDSFSNYIKTGHSLASTFYMDYLTFLQEDPRVEAANWHPIFDMLDDHRVGRFLRARGYEFHQFGSWWGGTYHNPTADVNRPHGFSEFNMMYLRRSILLPIFHLLPDTPLTMRLDWDNAQCQRVARQVEEIKRLGGGDRPVYVFAHILVPHGPYVFTPDGGCLDRPAADARGELQGYVDQVSYADAIIKDVLAALQAPERPEPVILIQADEGPFPRRPNAIPWQDATVEELRIKTGIIAAYHFPGGDYRALRQDITPVNSYRAIFNTVFGTEFAMLPDRIYAFPSDWEIYEFHDVTERVRCQVATNDSGLGLGPRC